METGRRKRALRHRQGPGPTDRRGGSASEVVKAMQERYEQYWASIAASVEEVEPLIVRGDPDVFTDLTSNSWIEVDCDNRTRTAEACGAAARRRVANRGGARRRVCARVEPLAVPLGARPDRARPACHDRRQSDSRRQGAADRHGAIERERRGARQRAIRRRRRFHRLQDPAQERDATRCKAGSAIVPAATWRAPITAGSAPSAEGVRSLIAGGALPLQRRLRHDGRLRFAAAVQPAEEAADVFQNQIARRHQRDQRREEHAGSQRP